MKRNRPLSPQAQDLVIALAIRPTQWRHGYELMKLCDLKSGTLYPILMRLADKGLLESKWTPPEQTGKPPRHAYRLTEDGLRVARKVETGRDIAAPLQEQLA